MVATRKKEVIVYEFTVRMTMTSKPDEVDVVNYASQALKYWGGSLTPQSPFFPEYIEKVSVDSVTAAAYDGPHREFGVITKRARKRKPRKKT